MKFQAGDYVKWLGATMHYGTIREGIADGFYWVDDTDSLWYCNERWLEYQTHEDRLGVSGNEVQSR